MQRAGLQPSTPIPNDTGAGIEAFTDDMTLLAPPPRGAVTGSVAAGENLFNQVGCADCHVASLKTGPSPVAALDHKVFHPYSDFLLHDIGTGDGIVQGQGTGGEIRTAPLWGLRAVSLYLHDGSAATIEGAINAHGGQATETRNRYINLNAANKGQDPRFPAVALRMKEKEIGERPFPDSARRELARVLLQRL